MYISSLYGLEAILHFVLVISLLSLFLRVAMQFSKILQLQFTINFLPELRFNPKINLLIVYIVFSRLNSKLNYKSVTHLRLGLKIGYS